jgi:hypothetical protein
MANGKAAVPERGRIATHGYQPLADTAGPPALGTSGVQRGYQPATAQQAPQPPNEGKGVQPPTNKEGRSGRHTTRESAEIRDRLRACWCLINPSVA